jgi:hypothetical protein
MRFKPSREWYVPKGSTMISDKLSDAIAYLYTDKQDRPCARVFYGKQAKPILACYFRDSMMREKSVTQAFESRRAHVGRKTAERDKRKAWVNPYKVGDLFRRSWGYDQTNVDWYEVTEVRGKMLTVRQICQERVETGNMCGKTTPQPGKFIEREEPIRCLAQDGCIKINHYAHAYFVKPNIIAGIPVLPVDYYSTYA